MTATEGRQKNTKQLRLQNGKKMWTKREMKNTCSLGSVHLFNCCVKRDLNLVPQMPEMCSREKQQGAVNL